MKVTMHSFLFLAFIVASFTQLSAASQTHYEVLGVKSTASQKEIERAFRDMVRAYHPDVAGSGGATKIRAVTNAYGILKDPDARRAYDVELTGATSNPGEGSMWEGLFRSHNYTNISQGLMRALVSASSILRSEELVPFALDFLRSKVEIHQNMNQRQFNSLTHPLTDIWMRIGFLPDYNNNNMEISKAASIAAFLFLADIHQHNPSAAQHCLRSGKHYLSMDLDRAKGSYARVLTEILKAADKVDLSNPTAKHSYSCCDLNLFLGRG